MSHFLIASHISCIDNNLFLDKGLQEHQAVASVKHCVGLRLIQLKWDQKPNIHLEVNHWIPTKHPFQGLNGYPCVDVVVSFSSPSLFLCLLLELLTSTSSCESPLFNFIP